MPQLERIYSQIRELEPLEREELLFFLTEELLPLQRVMLRQLYGFPALEYPSIVKTPGVCGGAARLIRTRIPIWVLVRMQQLGISEADILRSYPTLRSIDLVQAWSYALHHHEEIEKEIQENEAEEDENGSPLLE